jgi:hypothetical protein
MVHIAYIQQNKKLTLGLGAQETFSGPLLDYIQNKTKQNTVCAHSQLTERRSRCGGFILNLQIIGSVNRARMAYSTNELICGNVSEPFHSRNASCKILITLALL